MEVSQIVCILNNYSRQISRFECPVAKFYDNNLATIVALTYHHLYYVGFLMKGNVFTDIYASNAYQCPGVKTTGGALTVLYPITWSSSAQC